MEHTIKLEDFEGFLPKVRIAAQHSRNVNKTIDMYINPTKKRIWFEVSEFHKTIAIVPDIEFAIDLYNNI